MREGGASGFEKKEDKMVDVRSLSFVVLSGPDGGLRQYQDEPLEDFERRKAKAKRHFDAAVQKLSTKMGARLNRPGALERFVWRLKIKLIKDAEKGDAVAKRYLLEIFNVATKEEMAKFKKQLDIEGGVEEDVDVDEGEPSEDVIEIKAAPAHSGFENDVFSESMEESIIYRLVSLIKKGDKGAQAKLKDIASLIKAYLKGSGSQDKSMRDRAAIAKKRLESVYHIKDIPVVLKIISEL